MLSSLVKIGKIEIYPVIENGYSSVEWRICDILYLCAFSVFYQSDSFQFAGKCWHMELLIERGRYIYAHLVPESSSRSLHEFNVQFKLALKNADGTLMSGDKLHTAPAERTHEYGCFLSTISELERTSRTGLLVSDVITIVCCFKREVLHNVSLQTSAIAIAANPQIERESTELADASTQTLSENSIPQTETESAESADASTQTLSENCTEKLSRDLSELLLSEQDSDLTVQVKGVEFRLHRGIMGVRTPVFGAMLRHDMTEKSTGVVSVDDCEVEVFRDFIHYVYSGRVDELSTDTVFGLFTLADKYQVDELKSSCFEFIQGSLSVDTFCDVVTLALTYSQTQLLRQAIDFFAQNMEEILKTVAWMKYMKQNVIQANELILKAVQKIKSN